MTEVQKSKAGNYVPSEEIRRKISIAKTGHKYPPRSKEHCRKLSEMQLGALNHNYGKPISAGAKLKITLKNTGKTRPPMTEEQKLKISIANTGKKHPIRSEAYRNMISKRLTGVPKSMDHKIKLSCNMRGITKEEFDKLGFADYKQYCNYFNSAFFKNGVRTAHLHCVFPGCNKTKKENISDTGNCRELSCHHVLSIRQAYCEHKISKDKLDMIRKQLPTEIARFGEPKLSPEEKVYVRMVVPLCMEHHGHVTDTETPAVPYEQTTYRKHFCEILMKKYNGKSFIEVE